MNSRQIQTLRKMIENGGTIVPNGYCYPGYDIRTVRSLMRRGYVATARIGLEVTDSGREAAQEVQR